ncbi:hypothetical protein GWI33_022700 [Rhynchophorus ferrugineus]|uniref:Uncharacterized protein n=1 Tax=Rhynchophorus ferrugineus TaxID=354439 RepID=A0A834MHR7_RHYFE|nr:hypothetical protein GWI33_022700 [Rhynchophorus ferrugineus]
MFFKQSARTYLLVEDEKCQLVMSFHLKFRELLLQKDRSSKVLKIKKPNEAKVEEAQNREEGLRHLVLNEFNYKRENISHIEVIFKIDNALLGKCY